MQQIPPYSEKLLMPDGTLSRRWYLWFQSLKNLDDQISIWPSDTLTADYTVKAKDFGKILKFDNGNKTMTCQLPDATDSMIGAILTIVKLGSGQLRIKAGTGARIGSSNLGGTLVSAEPYRIENIRIFLETSTRWVTVGGLGVWYVV